MLARGIFKNNYDIILFHYSNGNMEAKQRTHTESFTLPQSNISLGPQKNNIPLISTSQVTAFPTPNTPQSHAALPKNYTYAEFPGTLQQSNIVIGNPQYPVPSILSALKQPRETERRITYHPYTRTYIQYQQQTILMPVQKVRIGYYQKIIETQYVPQAVEAYTTQTVAVEKQIMKVHYIPVEQRIVHFPVDQKKNTNSNTVRRVVVEAQKQPSKESGLVAVLPSTQGQGGERVFQQRQIYNKQNAGGISHAESDVNSNLYESEIKQSFGSQNPFLVPRIAIE